MDARLIEPGEALARIRAALRPLPSVSVPLESAIGQILAAPVRARVDVPGFDNSAMDGYALRARDARGASRSAPVRLALDADVYAGAPTPGRVAAGRARAVMTGAPIPRGADTVVPFEKAHVESSHLIMTGPWPAGRHVRCAGEDTRRGREIACAGDRIHAGTIAALATQGIRRVRAVRRARVGVLTTGDELVDPGVRLRQGQIYNSNAAAMRALLAAAPVGEVRVIHARDRRHALGKAVRDLLLWSDLVVTVGGVSMGRRDFVPGAFRGARVRRVFAGVAQKPGKPLWFGTRGRRAVFGLPGNPVSAFVCFCLYVYPAIDRLCGGAGAGLPVVAGRLDSALSRDTSRWMFPRGRRRGDGTVTLAEGQGSHQATRLAASNCIVEIAPGRRPLREGARVMTYNLPGAGAPGPEAGRFAANGTGRVDRPVRTNRPRGVS